MRKDSDLEEKRQRLGARLRALRQDRGTTQESLAERTGFHPTHIAKLEAGERLPSLEALIRLAAALEVPVSHIVEAVDAPSEAEPSVDDSLINEVALLLRGCQPQQIRFVKEFVRLLRRQPSGM